MGMYNMIIYKLIFSSGIPPALLQTPGLVNINVLCTCIAFVHIHDSCFRVIYCIRDYYTCLP